MNAIHHPKHVLDYILPAAVVTVSFSFIIYSASVLHFLNRQCIVLLGMCD